MRREWVVSGLTIVASTLVGAAIPLAMLGMQFGPGAVLVSLGGTVPDPEAEYYTPSGCPGDRGVYDACRWLSERPSGCMAMAVSFEMMHKFREESPGWVWPEPTVEILPVSTPDSYPAQQTPGP